MFYKIISIFIVILLSALLLTQLHVYYKSQWGQNYYLIRVNRITGQVSEFRSHIGKWVEPRVQRESATHPSARELLTGELKTATPDCSKMSDEELLNVAKSKGIQMEKPSIDESEIIWDEPVQARPPIGKSKIKWDTPPQTRPPIDKSKIKWDQPAAAKTH